MNARLLRAHLETGRLWLCGDGRLARPPSAARLGLSRQHLTLSICHFRSATPSQPRRAPPGVPGPTKKTSRKKSKLSAAPLPWPPSATLVHSFLDHHSRTRRCPPPEFLHPPSPRRPRYRAPHRHPLQCDSSARVAAEFPLTAAFCAA